MAYRKKIKTTPQSVSSREATLCSEVGTFCMAACLHIVAVVVPLQFHRVRPTPRAVALYGFYGLFEEKKYGRTKVRKCNVILPSPCVSGCCKFSPSACSSLHSPWWVCIHMVRCIPCDSRSVCAVHVCKGLD